MSNDRLDREGIEQQQQLLATYRRNVAHLLMQAAQSGGESFAPIPVANGLREARQIIHRIKSILRTNYVDVIDHPDDELPAFADSQDPLGQPLGAPRDERAFQRQPDLSSTTHQLLHLPPSLTSLIGRDADVDALETLLRDPDVRLVTLLGPGGIGKTRLAIAVARRALPFFRDGVCYVPLAAINDPALVAPAIAGAFGVKEQPGQPLATNIAAHLRDKAFLLVLDNFEQVLDAAPLVLDLLVDAPELHVLVTSREPLDLIGEQHINVHALDIPDLHALPTLPALATNPAVALFVQRARAIQPQFALTTANAPVVAEICARLDGIPLAIELVAAQLKGFLGLKDILARLDQVMLTAADRAHGRPDRHQTMRDTIAWSYGSLSTNEQMLFARLAVFSGGCSLDAAEAICDDGEQGQSYEILLSLVEKSLVQHHQLEDGQGRLMMLEVILAFARERLRARPDADSVRHRHAKFFQVFAERAAPALDGPEQQHWMDQLDHDRDNFRAATHWLLEHQQTPAALWLVGALWRFWYNRSYLSEGRQQLELSLGQARAEQEQGSLPATQEVSAAMARALDGLGSIVQKQGTYAEAMTYYQEALVYYRQIADEEGIAQTLYRLGLATMRAGDQEQARYQLEESLGLNKRLQNTRGAARAHNNLGMLAHYAGDYQTARHHYTESLALLHELEDNVNIAIGLGNIAEIAFMRGDFAEAQHNFTESLRMCDELDDPEGIAFCLDWLAQVAVVQRDALHAACLWSAAAALRKQTGVNLAPADREALAERIAEARALVTAKEWDGAWADGQRLSRAQAVELALK
jgi:predicted ATPase